MVPITQQLLQLQRCFKSISSASQNWSQSVRSIRWIIRVCSDTVCTPNRTDIVKGSNYWLQILLSAWQGIQFRFHLLHNKNRKLLIYLTAFSPLVVETEGLCWLSEEATSQSVFGIRSKILTCPWVATWTSQVISSVWLPIHFIRLSFPPIFYAMVQSLSVLEELPSVTWN